MTDVSARKPYTACYLCLHWEKSSRRYRDGTYYGTCRRALIKVMEGDDDPSKCFWIETDGNGTCVDYERNPAVPHPDEYVPRS